eukprot:12914158-Prorocentrum_lima.AAC.1
MCDKRCIGEETYCLNLSRFSSDSGISGSCANSPSEDGSAAGALTMSSPRAEAHEPSSVP